MIAHGQFYQITCFYIYSSLFEILSCYHLRVNECPAGLEIEYRWVEAPAGAINRGKHTWKCVKTRDEAKPTRSK